MRILLVEDDEAVAEVLVKKLREQHYQIDLATDGQIGWEFAETYDYDLVLLDVMLPILDGISFCKQRRAKGDRTPILLLTALDNSTSKIAGLDAGADDYVIKPFDLDELMARIRALLRRGIPSSPVMEWGKLQLDPSSCRVTYDGQLIHLTSKEYGLLEIFLRNNQRIFSLNALIGHLWSFDEFPLENTVRAHVKGLRQKLKKAGVGDVIETVYGLGYRLREKQEDTTRNAEVTETLIFQSSNNSLSDFARSTAQNLSGLPQSVTPKLAEAWNRYQDKYLDRLNVIDLALAAAKQSILSDDLRQQAWRQAHTLTGSLGSFGFDEASRLARKIEQVFKAEGKIGCEQVEPVTMWLKQLRDELDQPISTLGLDAKTLDAKILDAKTDNSKKAPDTIASQPTYLLIVDDDTELADQLVTEALAWGMRTTSVDHPDAAREFIRHTQPDIVLLDLCFSDSPERGFELLAELATHQPPIPVFVFTAQEDFADRVRVAQLGGRGFLQKPISPSQVLETIHRVLQHTPRPEATILVADPDAKNLDFIRSRPEPWGFRLILLRDFQQFWHTLEQANPDLLILDSNFSNAMQCSSKPSLSSIDLCRVIHNEPRWSALPILILTTQINAETLQQIFSAGADDYVHTPIVEAELLTRVLNRLERSQLLRHCANGWENS